MPGSSRSCRRPRPGRRAGGLPPARDSEKTYHHWKQYYGGLEAAETERLTSLEDEHRRLKKVVADQALDVAMLRDVVGREWRRPQEGDESSPIFEPPTR
jgi:hypothetical protein